MVKPVFLRNREIDYFLQKRVKSKPLVVRSRIVRKFDYASKRVDFSVRDLSSKVSNILPKVIDCRTKRDANLLLERINDLESSYKNNKKDFDEVVKFGKICFERFNPEVTGHPHGNPFDSRLHFVHKNLLAIEFQLFNLRATLEKV